LWKWVWRSTDHGTAGRTVYADADNTPSGYGQPNYSATLNACTVSPAVW
jgi:hypothetical protein